MSSDLLQSYFAALKNVKPARKEDIEKFWKKAQKGDKKAIKRLVELNFCLVIPIAKRFSKRGVDFMDLVADGNIGLMKAVEKFDSTRNVKFSTYATYWIEQYIRKSVEDNSKTIRVPSYMYDIINKWKKSRNDLMARLNREPTVKEISDILKISVEQGEEINSIIYSVDSISSLDTPVTEDSDSSKKETIRDLSAKTPESVTEVLRTSQHVQNAINYLPEREATVIRMKFGINDTPVASLDEIGKLLNLSRERVRQIELKAFQRLKSIFLKLNFASKETIDRMILDQRGTLPDRRQNRQNNIADDKRKLPDRRRSWQ